MNSMCKKDIAMKRLYLLMIIFIGFTLVACTTSNSTSPYKDSPKIKQPVPKIVSQDNPHATVLKLKSPITVALYSAGTRPEHPYKIIAKKSISKYNLVGIKRQEAVIHDALRNIAASMGGDAVINITKDDKKVTCEVVRFENKGWG